MLGNTEWAEANEHGCYNRAIVIRLTPDSSKGGLEEAILNENLFQDRLRMFFLSFMPQQLISYHQLYRKSSRLTGSVEYLVAVFVIDTEPLVMDMILHMYTQVHNSYFEPIRGVSLLTELVTYDLPLDSTSSSRNISVLSPDNMVTDYLEIVPIAYNGYNHSNGNSCIWQFFKLEVCPFVKIHLTELSAQIDNGFLYIESNTSTVIFNMFEYTIEFDTISLCVRDYSKVSVILDTGFGQSASTGSSNVVPVKQLLAFWCVCLSLLCLLITLVVYIALPQLQSQPGMNNIVLCISLLMAQAVYQFGAAQTSLPSWACELIGAVCHFLWLCVVFSMNVCSAEMFFVFRKLTRLPPRFSWAHTMRNITYIFLCSISFVLVNCVVSLSLSNGNSRGYGGSICYLSSYIMHLVTFVLPVVATVSSNIVFFSVVVLKLYKLAADSVNLQQERNYLTIYARLSTLTGLTWVFGFLQILLHNDVLEYLFIILNASQGIFIMIAFIFNKRTLVLCIKGINPQNNPQSLQDHKSKSNDIQHISITNHKTFK